MKLPVIDHVTGIQYRRVNKTIARKAYTNGRIVVLVPHNEKPFRKGLSQSISEGYRQYIPRFEAQVEQYTEEKCNFERGYYPHYYIDV